MLEFFRSFLNFIGRILMYFWTSFFQDTGSFFKIVAEAPFSSIFELLIVLFLVGVALTILIGTVRSVAGFSGKLLPVFCLDWRLGFHLAHDVDGL